MKVVEKFIKGKFITVTEYSEDDLAGDEGSFDRYSEKNMKLAEERDYREWNQMWEPDPLHTLWDDSINFYWEM